MAVARGVDVRDGDVNRYRMGGEVDGDVARPLARVIDESLLLPFDEVYPYIMISSN